MSEKHNTERPGIRTSQVVAAALAAVTAALLGSTLGVAGTVLGAGIASVVSTVGGALYLRSIQRTKQSVRIVHAKVVARTGATTVVDLTPEKAEQTQDAEPAEDDRSTRRQPGWAALIAGGVLAFAVGMLAITGLEWLRGEPLSGGHGTTIGGFVAPQPATGNDERPVNPPTTEPTTPTTTVTPPPSGSTRPETSQQPTTTTTPPTTTSTSVPTTEPSQPNSSVPVP